MQIYPLSINKIGNESRGALPEVNINTSKRVDNTTRSNQDQFNSVFWFLPDKMVKKKRQDLAHVMREKQKLHRLGIAGTNPDEQKAFKMHLQKDILKACIRHKRY